jgi:hypothetical protein
MWKGLIWFASADWMLRGRANGGTVILGRTIFVTAEIFLIAQFLHEISRPDVVLQPSWSRFLCLVHQHLTWLGAIFGAVYAALYTRFASQWSYLAGLYNQIMEVQSSMNSEDINAEKMAMWKAGFLVDADDLHLAYKPMFAGLVRQFLIDDGIRDVFVELNGEERADRLLAGANKALGKEPSAK